MSLSGKVALVAGATRGAGRGIALALAEAGARVWCTGRSTGSNRAARSSGPFDLAARPETVEQTARLCGGEAVVVDHSDEAQVRALWERVGDVDVLVNDIWGGDALAEWGVPFWQQSAEKGLALVERVLRTHVLTSRHARLRDGGLIVEITDGDSERYRGNLFYDLAKVLPIRLALALNAELKGRATAVAVTPGFLRSEAMLDHFGVTEATWRDAVAKDEHFAQSETPAYVGRAVAALAADPRVREKGGRVFASWTLAKEYGFTDADGRRPDWGAYFATLEGV
jgi:NAD(P)-dependent dehydrogenase (short-subunit alcohol dehydrogenase family)